MLVLCDVVCLYCYVYVIFYLFGVCNNLNISFYIFFFQFLLFYDIVCIYYFFFFRKYKKLYLSRILKNQKYQIYNYKLCVDIIIWYYFYFILFYLIFLCFGDCYYFHDNFIVNRVTFFFFVLFSVIFILNVFLLYFLYTRVYFFNINYIFVIALIFPNIFHCKNFLTLFILLEIVSTGLLFILNNKNIFKKKNSYELVVNYKIFFYYLVVSFFSNLFLIFCLNLTIRGYEFLSFDELFYSVEYMFDETSLIINLLIFSFFIKLGSFFFHFFKLEYYSVLKIQNVFMYSSFVSHSTFIFYLYLNLGSNFIFFNFIKYFFIFFFLIGCVVFIFNFNRKKSFTYLIGYSSVFLITFSLILL